jgi:hypothetical protein
MEYLFVLFLHSTTMVESERQAMKLLLVNDRQLIKTYGRQILLVMQYLVPSHLCEGPIVNLLKPLSQLEEFQNLALLFPTRYNRLVLDY